MSGSALFWIILHSPPVRYVLLTRLEFEGLYRIGLNRPHPFDRVNGTDTGGVASSGGKRTDHPYWGATPSVVRTVLSKIPSPEKLAFIDLGCGKGRPLFLASEFPFRSILGVELSPSLARIGQTNAAIMKQRYPERTPVEVIAGDAANYRLPPGDIALFLYNPFGEELMKKVVAEVEAALASEPRTIYVIYQNPVSGSCFDASPVLKRYFAANIPYNREERGFRTDVVDVMDAVIVWHGGNSPMLPLPGADAKILVSKMDYCNRAKLAT
jgi:SAM-dependent methyltransferase